MNILILSSDNDFVSSMKNLSVFSRINDSFKVLKECEKIKKYFFTSDFYSGFDIIFLDLDFLEDDMDLILTNFEIVNSFKSQLIGFSRDDSTIIQNINRPIFKRLFHLSSDFSNLVKFLCIQYGLKINQKNSNLLKFNVLQSLCGLGFSLNHIGTQYIVEGAVLAKSSKTYKLNQIYEQISLNIGIDSSLIAWNVNYAINQTLKTSNEKNIQKFFNIKDNRKPTAKIIISYFANAY